MDPAFAVEYIDMPLFEGPIMDTMLEPTMPTNACSIYDTPEERSYEWLEDRWVEASEADRLRQQLARQKNKMELNLAALMPNRRPLDRL